MVHILCRQRISIKQYKYLTISYSIVVSNNILAVAGSSRNYWADTYTAWQYQPVSEKIMQQLAVSGSIRQYHQTVSDGIRQYQEVLDGIRQYQEVSESIRQYQEVSESIR